jgi:hypothetical protein
VRPAVESEIMMVMIMIMLLFFNRSVDRTYVVFRSMVLRM